MKHSLLTARVATRTVNTRLPAYAAFTVSFVFAAAIILGFVG